jgi:hypothetical protein
MSDLKPSAPEFVDAVSIQTVLIHTEFLQEPLDISSLVSDLDVFEHLDKPYVTAVLGFVDIEDVVGVLNISGGERVSITLKSNLEGSVPVNKHFFIDKILSSNKVSDNEEFFAMHLIEDIAFLSNLTNINQSYTGSSPDIIKKIAEDFLGRDVNLGLGEADNQVMKVIIPNLTPIDAMCWIKNRVTTVDGYPYYLYSTLVGGNLHFYDMSKMLKDDVMNNGEGEEYTHYESQMSMPADKSKRRVIMAYQAKDTYDVYKLIDRGLIGSDYTYLNLTKKEKKKDNTFRFDINKEALDKLASFKKLWETTHRPLYDKTRYEWSSKTEINSRKITRIGSSQAFDGKKSLSEKDEVAQYRLNEVNRSLSQLLVSDPMSFIVNGLDFFNGEENTTVGNKLRVRFLRNTKVGDPTDLFDKKKSGDYLIFACKHSFTPRTYTLTFSGVKLSNGDIT